jgi:hypothetical protein
MTPCGAAAYSIQRGVDTVQTSEMSHAKSSKERNSPYAKKLTTSRKIEHVIVDMRCVRHDSTQSTSESSALSLDGRDEDASLGIAFGVLSFYR